MDYEAKARELRHIFEESENVDADIAAAIKQAVEPWEKALVGLTPSGSEFVGDPEYCATYVRKRIDMLQQIAKSAVMRSKRGEVA